MDIKKYFDDITKEFIEELTKVKTYEELSVVRIKYLSKKGVVPMLMLKIKEVSDKKSFGEAYNKIKNFVELTLNEKQKVYETEKLKQELEKEIEDIFVGMGYQVEDGPEVENDKFNFELLNIPSDHPARDMQDSLYIDSNILLRTHTSPVQARVMQKAKGKPIKVICPGKVYRRDDDDMTHSHQFGQVEGLVIDKNINMANLKATLELFIKSMFGEKREIRLRSSYFPFTEPSVEVDISCINCGGKGCSMCKNTGWIEILGAGMVNPKVLTMNGYDADEYSGFAFGIGIERVAMLRYGIDDIRRIYQNDIRFLSNFNKICED